MSGLVGHTLYAILGARVATARLPRLAAIAQRHQPSYLAGAYLGSDVQTTPEAVCVDTGRDVGYGTAPLAKSPLTGGAVRPWTLKHAGRAHTPRELYDVFYGRAHLVFGWARADREHAEPWDHLPHFFAATLEDAVDLYGPGERHLAYLLGWMAHVVSDSLIKSQHPGLDLHLFDGKYTPRNRPIQDLVSFHAIGADELRLDWPKIFADLAATPVEPVQFHYMRCTEPRGRLANEFPNLWDASRQPLLQALLVENRRWVAHHARDVLAELALTPGADGRPECSAAIRASTGLTYAQMGTLAEQAGFRRALHQIAEAIAEMWEATLRVSNRLAALR